MRFFKTVLSDDNKKLCFVLNRAFREKGPDEDQVPVVSTFGQCERALRKKGFVAPSITGGKPAPWLSAEYTEKSES